MKTRAAVLQMNSRADVEANLQSLERLVAEAAELGSRLAVAPECFAYLGPEEGKFAIAERLPEGGPILDRSRALARKFEIELILGGFFEKTEDPKRVRNACVHLGKDGSVCAVYRKVHLFDVDLPDGTKLEESAGVEPGSEIVVTQTAIGAVGLSICYDLRFPELYRQLVDRGATSFVVPSAFTLTTGKDHWHVLLRARAIEGQSYVLAAAQTGHHFGQRNSYGHALIADPWGCVLAECGEGEGVAVANIDDDVVRRIRAALPSLQHRRLLT